MGAEFGQFMVGIGLAVITGAISGSVSSQRTIAALTVHIEYLKSHIERHEAAISRAHQRVDDLERRAA